MPCCAPRYGALIVAGIDFFAGITGLIVLAFRNSAMFLVCVTFPATILVLLGSMLALAYIKRHYLLATISFGLNILLIVGCATIILILMANRDFRTYAFTPVITAALFYGIIVQAHFSWVVHDFKTHRLYLGCHRRLQYLDNQTSSVSEDY
ncbi:unnamed protein product [Allacma fusca]|uniref:Uncharacterized protein n=1 Tax=Allacma fusca TaxID=39272 RepID=A0A8J2PM83_9HEXA|nr:unnamed protein product [Allacma fusca]